ncbi:MAG: peptide-methionine (S)-S-oxide reductase MsrA [Oscillatoriaceae cyanobacterium Prado104]|jgi:methionine-S-sulfoxide reductase|nr:peptide-methionine (S)-S-oxide reductase MsrA [Oscillatoriaceae cyanobacterium Prado104]
MVATRSTLPSKDMPNLLPMDAKLPPNIDTATFGLGCFWSPDAQFGILEGVVRTRVGYAGGTTENPNYYNIGNHIETVQIDFDRALLSYSELLNIFWRSHNPRQLPTWSRQYMDAVFYCDEQQAELARSKLKSEQAAAGEIHTLVEPLTAFYLAEDYHQKYYLRQATELMKEFDLMYDRTLFINSTVAARVNGYVAGCGSLPALKAEIKEFGLSAAGCERLEKIVSKNRY